MRLRGQVPELAVVAGRALQKACWRSLEHLASASLKGFALVRWQTPFCDAGAEQTCFAVTGLVAQSDVLAWQA